MQSTDQVLMIRPAAFGANPQTAASNAFQTGAMEPAAAQACASREFDAYATALRRAGVGVLVVADTPTPHTPDAIFPNNWFSCDGAGRVFLYPMAAPNRRLERRMAVLAALEERFEIAELVDLGHFAGAARFLEGTGSVVFDHEHKLAYVCRSPRSHPAVMDALAAHTGYRQFWFSACDRRGVPVYHTNVMLCIGRTFVVACLEAVTDVQEREALARALSSGGRQLINISHAQMEHFAGNMLELRSHSGAPVVALSRRAWAALDEAQQRLLSAYATLVIAHIDTIERLGGGGARCMLAEIFLPKRHGHT